MEQYKDATADVGRQWETKTVAVTGGRKLPMRDMATREMRQSLALTTAHHHDHVAHRAEGKIMKAPEP